MLKDSVLLALQNLVEARQRVKENNAVTLANSIVSLYNLRREYEKERYDAAYSAANGRGKSRIRRTRDSMWRAIERGNTEMFIEYERRYNELLQEAGVTVAKSSRLEEAERIYVYIETSIEERNGEKEDGLALRMDSMWIWCKQVELNYANAENRAGIQDCLETAEVELNGTANKVGSRVYEQFRKTYENRLETLNECVDSFIRSRSNGVKALVDVLGHLLQTDTLIAGQMISVGLLCVGRALYNKALRRLEKPTRLGIEEEIKGMVQSLKPYDRVMIRGILAGADIDLLRELPQLEREKFGLAVLIFLLPDVKQYQSTLAGEFRQTFERTKLNEIEPEGVST